MKILIGYATSEGHTRKICRHIADHLVAGGVSVELLPLAEAEGLELSRFDRVILAASVHAGHYQRALSDFVAAQPGALAAHPALFLSVSLAAAGHDDEDWKGLDKVVEDLTAATGWQPQCVAHVAGAYRPADYDLLRRFVMRQIIARKDPEADLDRPKEYTDWPALEQLVQDWLAD